MELPPILIDNIRNENVVLVLGAGASIGSTKPDGSTVPAGPQLAKMLSDKFLGGAHATDTLSTIAELAISETDLFTVQEHIRTVFEDLQPAQFHQLLPTFRWAALATTNFDLVVERAYQQCEDRAQQLVPFIKNGDRIEDRLRSTDGVKYLKLHGCITHTADHSVPLILSVDQYIAYRKGRDRIFNQLNDLSYEKTFVFVGHSLQDTDIRALMLEYEQRTLQLRPRFYTVVPTLSDPQRRFWERKKITLLEGTFEQFLTTLNGEISNSFRGVAIRTTTADLPVARRFIIPKHQSTNNLKEFMQNDVEHLHNAMTVGIIDPPMFYKGYNPGWAAIEQSLDVRRDIEEPITLSTVFEQEQDFQLHVIKGHAGSGKTVLLQRIAWEAAIEFDSLTLYLKPDGFLSTTAIEELSTVTNERIFLFIDDIDKRAAPTSRFIKEVKRAQLPVTIIAAARMNEWNMSCRELQQFVTSDFEVEYLSMKEIDQLLALLEAHQSLFRLEVATPEERRDAFSKRAGRQLLVALHEATLGKPFEEIITDEYLEIRPDSARTIYLGICFLHRHRIDVRAGIINRAYGINFQEFSRRFFDPLEGLVFTNFNRRIQDNTYETRHPNIAEIVVSSQLTDPSLRYDMHIQMLNSINIDYSSDRQAFRRLTHARTLHHDFPNYQMVQSIFINARLRAGDDPTLLHQMAIYQMIRPNGSLDEAATLLNQAHRSNPRDTTISHSLAELELKKAEIASNDIQFNKHINDAQKAAKSLIGPNASDSYGYHTIAKASIAKIRRTLNNRDEQLNNVAIIENVKEAESAIHQGLQRFPDDPYLLATESDMGELFFDDERSLQALESAFQVTPDNPFIVARLGKVLTRTGQFDKAMDLYKIALETGLNDKRIHFSYAKLLIDETTHRDLDIEFHLRRAFTDGDQNKEAQFWYGRQLFLNRKAQDAQRYFTGLRDSRVNWDLKTKIRGVISKDGQHQRFTGSVQQLSGVYGFVNRDGAADRVYLHRNNSEPKVWNELDRGSRISFAIGFNYWGATAIEIDFETSQIAEPAIA